MSDYYDSKGVRHSSEWDRDSANRRYLSEERDARDKHTELLQQQARLQAEQLRVAEDRAREQRAHDERIEDLAREQAAKDEAQREFTKDIQWLERSDAKGRFEYLLRKGHGDIVGDIAGFVFARSSMAKSPVAAQRRSGLRSALTEFYDASRACADASAELDRIKKGLASAKEAEGLGCLAPMSALGALLLAFISLGSVWVVIAELAKSNTNGEQVAGSALAVLLCGGGALALYAKYVAASNKAKQDSAQKAELAPLEPQVQKRLEACKKDLAGKRAAARTVYESWHAESAATLSSVTQSAIRDGSVSEKLKASIGQIETEFPPLLRIDWAAVDSTTLAHAVDSLAEDVLNSAVRRHVGTSLLVSQLGVSGEEQLAAKLASSNSLMGEIASDGGPLLS